MTTHLFNKMAFVGIGLINGSLARDCRRLGVAKTLAATSRRTETLEEAKALGLVDQASPDLREVISDADIVVLGVPVAASGKAAASIAPHLSPQTIVTDVGSIKRQVMLDVLSVIPHPSMFVPGHPVAGTERSGPAAAIDDLFRNRRCILTPDENTDAAALGKVEALWRAVGSEIDIMDAEHHDRVLAVTSHLPHLLAFNIVSMGEDYEAVLEKEVLRYAAGGFTDFTRIAASDPVMWRDVFLNNKTAMLEVIGRYVEDLMALQRAIRWNQGDVLEAKFTQSRRARREVTRMGQAYERQPVPPKTNGHS